MKPKGPEYIFQVLEPYQERLKELGVRKLGLFGSFARGESKETSDLDFLVELESGRSLLDIIAIKQDLEDLLNIKVDVVTEAAVSPYIRDEVLRQAISL